MITRLRLDARLFTRAQRGRNGTGGRKRIVGQSLQSLAERLANPKTAWRRFWVEGWYGGDERRIEFVSGTAIWQQRGKQVRIRYVLVRDVAGELKPQAFLCTDLEADPLEILRCRLCRSGMSPGTCRAMI